MQRWKPLFRQGRLPQYAGLAAAACLLLVLGVALPRSASVASVEPVTTLTYSSPVAERSLPVVRDDAFLGQMVEVHDLALRKGKDGGDRLEKVEDPLVRIDASVQALEAKGAKREATQLVRLYANNLTRQALVYQEKGDLVAAEPALNQACRLCQETLGPKAPETIRTRQSLAGFYEVALNTAPATSYAFGVDSPVPALSASSDKERTSSAEREYFRNFHGGVNPYAIGAHPYNMAAPAPSAQPLRTASSYAPSTSDKRPPKQARAGYAADSAKAAVAWAKHAGRNAVSAPQEMAVVALRDHITQQSQAELKTSVVPVLTQALKDAKDGRERQRLERALGQLGPAARDAVPLLIDCYHQAHDSSERAVVLLTLGQIGPAARQAVPVLVDSLHNSDRLVRDSAARALVLLGPVVRHYGKELDKKTTEDPLVQHVVRYINSPEGRSGIEDDAECFSVKALRQAQDRVRFLATSGQVEIRFETVRGKDALKAKKEELDQLTPHHCVFVCIDKEAPIAHIHFSEGLRKQGWSEAQLQEALEPYLRKKEYDRGLRAGLQVLANFEKKQVKQ